MPTIDRVPNNWLEKNLLNRESELRSAIDVLTGFELITIAQRSKIIVKLDNRVGKAKERLSE